MKAPVPRPQHPNGERWFQLAQVDAKTVTKFEKIGRKWSLSVINVKVKGGNQGHHRQAEGSSGVTVMSNNPCNLLSLDGRSKMVSLQRIWI